MPLEAPLANGRTFRPPLEQGFRALSIDRRLARFEAKRAGQCEHQSLSPGVSYFISTFLCYWRGGVIYRIWHGDASSCRDRKCGELDSQSIHDAVERRRIISLEISLMNNSRARGQRVDTRVFARRKRARTIRNDRLL